MTSISNDREQPAALSDEQRHALVDQIVSDWPLVHGGNGPGCYTGIAMMSDRELVAMAQEYRAKAIAVIGDDR